MTKLTDGQQRALRHLAAKKGGAAVPFVNIADARALTELGLASRSREGWDITAEGASLAESLPPQAAGPALGLTVSLHSPGDAPDR